MKNTLILDFLNFVDFQIVFPLFKGILPIHFVFNVEINTFNKLPSDYLSALHNVHNNFKPGDIPIKIRSI